MTEVEKIKGILDAIEAESKLPAPSHANLARLTHMALVEMMNFLDLLCKGLVPFLIKNVPPPEQAQTEVGLKTEIMGPEDNADQKNPDSADQPSTVQPA